MTKLEYVDGFDLRGKKQTNRFCFILSVYVFLSKNEL